MPTGYVKKLAKKHHTTVGKSEDKWDKAKAVAKKQGKEDNFAYITGIYKKMMGESIKNMTLKQYLMLEIDSSSVGSSEIAYGGDKEDQFDEFGNENFDEFGDDEFGDDEFEDDDIEDADDISYGDMDDESGSHKLSKVIPPEDMDDEGDEFGDDEFDQEDDLEPSDEFDDELEPPDEFDDQDEYELDDSQDFREGVGSFGLLKNLMIINEKKEKKGKGLKKAAKSVYHRDYIKTKNKPYRKYDPKAREHEARSS